MADPWGGILLLHTNDSCLINIHQVMEIFQVHSTIIKIIMRDQRSVLIVHTCDFEFFHLDINHFPGNFVLISIRSLYHYKPLLSKDTCSLPFQIVIVARLPDRALRLLWQKSQNRPAPMPHSS